MATQTVFDFAQDSAFEAVSCVWLELMMFAVATTTYVLLVQGGFGSAAGALKPSQISGKQQPNHAKSFRQSRTSYSSVPAAAPSDVQNAISTIRACGRAQDLTGAVAAFDKLRASAGSPTPQVHNCLIDVRLQCNDLSGALRHFQELAHEGTADVVTYNTVLKALLSRGKAAEAKELLNEMAKHGLPATRVTFHELLNSEVMAGNHRGMWKVVDDMRAAGHAPDAITCAILVKSLKDGAHPWNIDRVMKLVSDIGEAVDEILLSSLAEACVRMRRMDLLSDAMRRFERDGLSVKLTASSYGSLIKAYGQEGDLRRAWEMWGEMVRGGVEITAVTLGCMTDALVKNGCVEDAWKLAQEVYAVEETRSLVNTVIYSTIVKGFAWAKDMDRTFKVFAEMSERGVACNVITFNTMIDACARCGAMDRVPRVLAMMPTSGVEPDLVTYSALVKGYCLAGDLSRAFQVLEEMKFSDGLVPDEIMYNSLLDGCAKEQRIDEALKLLRDMQAAGIVPSNHTLSILVKLLGRARRLEECFKLMNELTERHGFRPNIQVYTCLIQACLNNRRLDRAMKVHDEMVADARCKPDEKAYSVLVRGCVRANGLDQALHALRCAYQLSAACKEPANGSVRRRRVVPGVEAEVLEEALYRLRSSSGVHRQAADRLVADVKTHHGLDLDSASHSAIATSRSARARAEGNAARRGRCA